MRLVGLLIIVLLLALGAGYLFTEKTNAPVVTPENSYANDRYGISFSYPTNYTLTENRTDADGVQYAIVLTRSGETLPVNGEGPTTVTITVFEDATLDEWLESPRSNLMLGSGETEPSMVGDMAAVTFRWSGLYEGETTAFQHGENVIAISKTWIAEDDDTHDVYVSVLNSFSFR
ncbi:MAG TPA: hypothetical protein VEB18_02310 [Candidatus Paceibacterota bacterium]|nr:hypothetical protein [Candidatus Paceibacterota bacterium]